MQNIAKAALIICAAILAYLVDIRILIFWLFVLFDWE